MQNQRSAKVRLGREYSTMKEKVILFLTENSGLHRLLLDGTVRRVIRGIYDYRRFSTLLNQELSPDEDQVAHSLARKFGWRIQPSGPAAQTTPCSSLSTRH